MRIIGSRRWQKGHGVIKEHQPEFVITDFIVPEKEGLESIRELKKINPDKHMIAISGGGMTDPKTYLNLASKLGAVRAFGEILLNCFLEHGNFLFVLNHPIVVLQTKQFFFVVQSNS